MTSFELLTTDDRVLMVRVGEPLTNLAPGEYVSRIKRVDGDGPLSDEEAAWMRAHVQPHLAAFS